MEGVRLALGLGRGPSFIVLCWDYFVYFYLTLACN